MGPTSLHLRREPQQASKYVSNQMPAPQVEAPRQIKEPFLETVSASLKELLPCWALGQVGQCAMNSRAVPQFLWSCGSYVPKPLLVSKANVLGLISQEQVLKVGGPNPLWGPSLCTLRRSSLFWVPSWLWVAVPGMEFTVRSCPSLFYPRVCGAFSHSPNE